jgi:hypothetical protein
MAHSGVSLNLSGVSQLPRVCDSWSLSSSYSLNLANTASEID